MNALLDTHIFLWYLQGNLFLSNALRDAIESEENTLYFSIISLWEIAIKLRINKLDLQRPFSALQEELKELKISTLPVSFADAEIYLTLPLHHRDPFDRIIIAQAIHHKLSLISRDAVLDAYPFQRLWL